MHLIAYCEPVNGLDYMENDVHEPFSAKLDKRARIARVFLPPKQPNDRHKQSANGNRREEEVQESRDERQFLPV